MSENQVVIVTGGARGIGFGIGNCFARKGASVVVADVNLEQAQAAAQKLNEAGGVGCIGLSCDVTDRAQVDAMADRVVAELGRIDVLVNNAGVCPFIDAMEISPEVWKKTIDINTHGVFHCTQSAARKMIERGKGGRVITITSLAAHASNAGQADYAASKAGALMATSSFAIALGKHGITCNSIAPGMLATEMTRHFWDTPEGLERARTRIPLQRVGTPEDIGHAAVFLASPEAAYISGIEVRVDGGHEAVCG